MIDVNVRPLRNKQAPRKIFLYPKADLAKLQEEAATFSKKILEADHSDRNVEDMWQNFKSELERIVTKHFPSRNKSSHKKLPWITRETKLLLNKRDKAYVRMKKYLTTDHSQHYRALKKAAQFKLRQSSPHL